MAELLGVVNGGFAPLRIDEAAWLIGSRQLTAVLIVAMTRRARRVC